MNRVTDRSSSGMRRFGSGGFNCLRKTLRGHGLDVLRTVWKMRWRGVAASLALLPSHGRYLVFAARRDGIATTVFVNLQACIAWRFPDAIEFAWSELSDAALKSVFENEPWDRFIPAPTGGWDALSVERVCHVDEPARAFVHVVVDGVSFLYERLPWDLDIDIDAGPVAIPGHYPIAVRVDIGYTMAPLPLIATMRPGDVIKISATTLVLRALSSSLLHLALVNGVLIVSERPFPSFDDAFDDVAPESADFGLMDRTEGDVSPLTMEDLPVPLSFSFAPFVLTLAELTSLRAGDVVPLEGAGRLTIFANGKRVGNAELVEVEGALAAEVTSLQLESKTKNA
jgi:type III secretion protein Q